MRITINLPNNRGVLHALMNLRNFALEEEEFFVGIEEHDQAEAMAIVAEALDGALTDNDGVTVKG